jgi:hypothetical protein
MRVSGAVVGIALAACGGARMPEAAREVEVRPSYRDVRPGEEGCIHGDCVSGVFARRVGDRVVAGTVGDEKAMIEWERGACAGWTYRGGVADDVPDGDGVLTAPKDREAAIVDFASRFDHGAATGRGVALALLSDGKRAHVEGELEFRTTDCHLRVDRAETTVIRDLSATIDGASVAAEFRGVVRVRSGALQPWRGRLAAADGSLGAYGYVDTDGAAWRVIAASVCLSGDCMAGGGIELYGGSPLRLYAGPFTAGVRDGDGIVRSLESDTPKAYGTTYSAGELDKLELVRAEYRIQGAAVDVSTARLDGNVAVEGVPIRSARWRDGDGLIGADLRAGAAYAPTGLPAQLKPDVAAAAVLSRDVARGTLWRTCLVDCVGDDGVFVVTDGAATPFVANGKELEDGTLAQLGQVWRVDHRQLLAGVELTADLLGRLHGTADLGGRRVVFYRGVRVDTLGYATLDDYTNATAKARAARATKAAKKSAAVRAAAPRLASRLTRVLDGAGTAISALAVAKEAIAREATDGPAYERAIREAHAAVERAEAGALDAEAAATEALAELDPGDPCVDSLARAGAQLRDLDERLQVLDLAFEAFQYSDHVDRLATVARMLGDGLGEVRTIDLQASATQLRAAIGGAPQPLPEP